MAVAFCGSALSRIRDDRTSLHCSHKSEATVRPYSMHESPLENDRVPRSLANQPKKTCAISFVPRNPVRRYAVNGIKSVIKNKTSVVIFLGQGVDCGSG